MGMLMAMLGSKGSGPAMLSSAFAQTTGTSLTITKPAGVVSGTLLVAVMASTSGAGAQTWTGDTGWIERADENAGANLRIATLVAGGAEPVNYTFAFSGSAVPLGGYIMAFPGATYDSISAVGFVGDASDLVIPSTTFSANGLLLAVCAHILASKTIPVPAGMTALLTDTDATAPSLAIFNQYVASGATGTRTSASPPTGGCAGYLVGLI